MKKGACILCLICLMCLLVGCAGKGELGLYVLNAEQVRENMSAGEIGKLALKDGRLALTGEDFAGVDWQQQRFALRPEAVPSVSVLTPESGGSSLLKTTDKEVFVWVLDGKALYVGGFPMGISNPATPRSPLLRDQERYVFAIEHKNGEDKRFNKSLYRYFSDHGLLKIELN